MRPVASRPSASLESATGASLAPCRWTAIVLLLGLVLIPGAGLGAQQGADGTGADSARSDAPEVHPEAERAISRLKSPFCPGLMLEVCPSEDASQLRDTLRVMAEGGASADSLVAWTLARYGEEWRAIPETRGSDLLAWVVPPLAILLGGGLVVLALRRLRRRDGDGAGGEVRSLSEEEERRITEALSELEREGR